MRNLHPADELAMIRDDIKRLKERETYLRNGFLRNTWPRRGAEAEVEVKSVHSRVLLRDKLPAAILNDPSYWQDRRLRQVRVKPLGAALLDNFDVFERF